MASWMIHLRIADRLLPSFREIDETAFVIGNIAPDSGVPNEDETAYFPPKTVSHFQRKTESGSRLDTEAFQARYFTAEVIRGYDLRKYSFFLGYYVHLLTDIRWSGTIIQALKQDYPEEYMQDKNGLVRKAKEDWYDLDFLYLKEHPDFNAFSLYESAEHFDNDLMDLFSRDAFEDRRQFICSFYRSEEHGDLYREYRYLTKDQADRFVLETSEWILEKCDIPEWKS